MCARRRSYSSLCAFVLGGEAFLLPDGDPRVAEEGFGGLRAAGPDLAVLGVESAFTCDAGAFTCPVARTRGLND
jgi:hypothetical protein